MYSVDAPCTKLVTTAPIEKVLKLLLEGISGSCSCRGAPERSFELAERRLYRVSYLAPSALAWLLP